MTWWRRIARESSVGSAPSGTDGRALVTPLASPARAPAPSDWTRLVPLQRSLHPIDVIAPLAPFVAGLATRGDPRFIAPLGHARNPGAPSGEVDVDVQASGSPDTRLSDLPVLTVPRTSRGGPPGASVQHAVTFGSPSPQPRPSRSDAADDASATPLNAVAAQRASLGGPSTVTPLSSTATHPHEEPPIPSFDAPVAGSTDPPRPGAAEVGSGDHAAVLPVGAQMPVPHHVSPPSHTAVPTPNLEPYTRVGPAAPVQRQVVTPDEIVSASTRQLPAISRTPGSPIPQTSDLNPSVAPARSREVTDPGPSPRSNGHDPDLPFESLETSDTVRAVGAVGAVGPPVDAEAPAHPSTSEPSTAFTADASAPTPSPSSDEPSLDGPSPTAASMPSTESTHDHATGPGSWSSDMPLGGRPLRTAPTGQRLTASEPNVTTRQPSTASEPNATTRQRSTASEPTFHLPVPVLNSSSALPTSSLTSPTSPIPTGNPLLPPVERTSSSEARQQPVLQRWPRAALPELAPQPPVSPGRREPPHQASPPRLPVVQRHIHPKPSEPGGGPSGLGPRQPDAGPGAEGYEPALVQRRDDAVPARLLARAPSVQRPLDGPAVPGTLPVLGSRPSLLADRPPELASPPSPAVVTPPRPGAEPGAPVVLRSTGGPIVHRSREGIPPEPPRLGRSAASDPLAAPLVGEVWDPERGFRAAPVGDETSTTQPMASPAAPSPVPLPAQWSSSTFPTAPATGRVGASEPAAPEDRTGPAGPVTVMSLQRMFEHDPSSAPTPSAEPVSRLAPEAVTAADAPWPSGAVLQRDSETSELSLGDHSASMTAAAPTAEVPAARGAIDVDIDDLARRLFDPLSARLRAELWLDRERAGLIADLRR